MRVGRDIANIAGGHAADEGDAMSRAPTCARPARRVEDDVCPPEKPCAKRTCARNRSAAARCACTPCPKNFGLTISARSGAGAAEAR